MINYTFDFFNVKGFRIKKFRLFYSKDLRGNKLSILKEEFKLSGDLISERNLIIKYLIQHNEIQFTIYFIGKYLMFLSGSLMILILLFFGHRLFVSMVLLIVSLIFYFISGRYREYFILGNFGIDFTETIYNSEIKSKYNF